MQDVAPSITSKILDFHKPQRPRQLSFPTTGKFFHAIHARENSAAAPGGIEVWKYTFPLAANRPIDDLHVRIGAWTGIFECAHGRHVDVLTWPEAHAVVVAAANAIYIVNPDIPHEYSGFAAHVEITDITFDETSQHLFVADSLHIYAFSADRTLQWMSEPFDGYGAHFRGCGGRVLAVEIKQLEPEPEAEDLPSMIRLRTEDGTILRSRFRLANRYLLNSGAA